MHPSGIQTDEVAGQRALHMHRIWHAPAQSFAVPELVPRNSPFETFGL